jgi:hypothetical protein
MFSFVEVRLYVAIGRAYLDQGSFPHKALSPKVGNKKSMICKRIESL